MPRLLSLLLLAACSPDPMPEPSPSRLEVESTKPPQEDEEGPAAFDTGIVLPSRAIRPDADGDGVLDAYDVFPVDPTRTLPQLSATVRFWPGDVKLGSPETEIGHFPNERQVLRRMPYSFVMGIYEVTSEAWHATMTHPAPNPSRAVDNVSFREAALFANRLSQDAGLERCYRFEHDGDCPTVELTPSARDCEGFRLPTPLEWEFAARNSGRMFEAYPSGGSLSRLPASCLDAAPLTDGRDLEEQAHTCANPGDGTVGTLRANAAGIFDLAGNMAEWVWTDMEPRLREDGTCTSLQNIRGGDRGSLPARARIAAQSRRDGFEGHPNVGVRLVRTIKP